MEHSIETTIYDVGSPSGSLTWSTFQYWCACGNFKAIEQYFSQHNLDAESSSDIIHIMMTSREKYTCLHIAARYGYTSIVQFLCSHSIVRHVDTVDKVRHFER